MAYRHPPLLSGNAARDRVAIAWKYEDLLSRIQRIHGGEPAGRRRRFILAVAPVAEPQTCPLASLPIARILTA
jgi:hypothetical protein